jgi:asparagine synthase (glutamine-hydrolysing)
MCFTLNRALTAFFSVLAGLRNGEEGGRTPARDHDGVCGLVVCVSGDGGVSGAAIDRALERLRHRGPDVQHSWVSPGGRAGLGHARLRIVDLAGGDQPIVGAGGRLRIVVNGALHGFEQQRRRLEDRGHRFATGSDSEVALHLFEERGPDAMNDLRGEFALAIWDEAEQRLFAARDRFGVKPLYYAVHAGAVYLASEVKALAALGVPLRWEPEVLHDVHFVARPPDRTLFAGVHEVPPGHFMITDGTATRLVRYWQWTYPPADARPDGSPRDWIDRLRHTLDEAVRLRLRADVPVGCYLSGGLDSCAVLGLAAQHAPRPIRAFTVSLAHPDYDETAIARRQAERSGAELCCVPVGAADLAEHFADAVRHAEHPLGNAHAVAKYLLSRAAQRAGTTVVLSGEGSDEILAGYPHFRLDLLRHDVNGADPAARARALGELAAANQVSAGTLLPRGEAKLAGVERVLGFVPAQLEAWSELAATLTGLLDPAFRAQFAGRDTYRAMLADLDVDRCMRGRAAVNQAMYLWGRTILPSYILTVLADRMEMAHSIEGRLPFLDHVVADVAARMPVELKIRGGVEKYALREAARSVLTDEVYRRQKHPFMTPPATLATAGPLFTFVQDTLRGAELDGPGIYHRPAVVALLDAVPSMCAADRPAADFALMWITSLCLLHSGLGVRA